MSSHPMRLCRMIPALLFAGASLAPAAGAAEAKVQVKAGEVLITRETSLIGGNIEDLNFQLYGGLYSQLLHGECFEEDVDPTDLFGLTGRDRFAYWVVRDAGGGVVLRHFRGTGWGLAPRRPGPTARFPSPAGEIDFDAQGDAPPARLPGDLGARLTALATGDAQASRHWRPVKQGTAAGKLTLVRGEGVLTGNQAQRIEFLKGEGEFGVDNAGLFRQGINLTGGKPYEGLLRIESAVAQEAVVSLRAADGRILAEQTLALAAKPGAYQRLEFTLTPSASDGAGRFALTLRRPGTIRVDYAFLQAGAWGRFKGLPVRQDLARPILDMGVATLRYNGSMVNSCPDGATLYKWKKMIGPRDERQPYTGWFNPYASHGFSIFEFMDFCEAAGFACMVGLRTDETAQDMADFVDYCLGGADTEWGRRRIADGHPKPYALTAVQIGNEDYATPAYRDRVKDLAAAVWSRNKNVDVFLSINVGRHDKPDIFVELAKWVREIGQEKHLALDSHYGSTIEHADVDLDKAVGLRLHDHLAREVPGFHLRLWPMEENGMICSWNRGLAHAHILNTLQRMPAAVERAGTANTLQAWNLTLTWNQGRIHFTPTQIFYQASYYVDRLYADEWLPAVVQAACDVPTLDVLAKKSADGRVLALYLVNIAEEPVTAVLNLDGFTPAAAAVTRLHAPNLNVQNTAEKPDAITPRKIEWKWDAANPRIDLPAHSFTTIRLSR